MATARTQEPSKPQPDVMTAWVIPLIVEAIGTLALCFIGIGAIAAVNGGDLVAIALAHGLAIGVMVAAGGHLSGFSYNPAVTLGLAIAGKLKPDKAVADVIAERVAAVAGALLIQGVFTADAVEAARPPAPPRKRAASGRRVRPDNRA